MPAPETQMSQQEVFQAYRPLLFSIAYRMLGRVMDAEDCVQEAFLQWYASKEGQAIENPKAYLCTLVTRRCIDLLRSARVQREAYVGLWLPEPVVTNDPAELPELAESLSMTFLLLLERLSPVERAVFLLRQIFDYDYAEIAAIVGKSEENCRQVMHRARRHLRLERSFSPAPLDQQQQVLAQFLQAYMNGDMDGLLRALSDEVVSHSDGGGVISAALNPLYGPQRVARYLLGIRKKYFSLEDVSIRYAQINGQLGLVIYLHPDFAVQKLLVEADEAQQSGQKSAGMRKTTRQQIELYRQAAMKGQVAVAAVGFTIVEKRIREINIVVNPEKLRHIPPLSD